MTDFAIHQVNRWGLSGVMVFEGNVSLKKAESGKVKPIAQLAGIRYVFLFRGDDALKDELCKFLGGFFGLPFSLHDMRPYMTNPQRVEVALRVGQE